MPIAIDQTENQSRMKKLRIAWAAAVMVGAVSPAAGQVQITADVLTTGRYRTPYSISSRNTVGSAANPDNRSGVLWHHPAIWTNFSSDDVEFLPIPELHVGEARATTENYVAGYVASVDGESTVATLWVGEDREVVQLNPQGMPKAVVLAATDEEQGGFVGSATAFQLFDIRTSSKDRPSGGFVSVQSAIREPTTRSPALTPRAAIWRGSAETYVDVHPADFSESMIIDTDGTNQVGYVAEGETKFAAVWSGSSSSFQNLHPEDADESTALSTDDGLAVGFARYSETCDRQPVLWHLDEERAERLQYPDDSFIFGEATDVLGDIIVGYGFTSDSRRHALLWLDDGQTVINLDKVLPSSGYTGSSAVAISRAGDSYLIAGSATLSWRIAPAVWTVTVPEPQTFSLAFVVFALGGRSRRAIDSK